MDIKHALVAMIIVLSIGFVSGVLFGKAQQNSVTGAITTIQQEQGSLTEMRQRFSGHKIQIPEDAFIAQIADIGIVQQQQPELYRDARNGDYIIAFGDRVIVYDYHNNQIITDTTIKKV